MCLIGYICNLWLKDKKNMFINASCPNLQPYFQASAQSIQLCRLQLQHLQPPIYTIYPRIKPATTHIYKVSSNTPATTHIYKVSQNTPATTHVYNVSLQNKPATTLIYNVSQNTPATTHIYKVSQNTPATTHIYNVSLQNKPATTLIYNAYHVRMKQRLLWY